MSRYRPQKSTSMPRALQVLPSKNICTSCSAPKTRNYRLGQQALGCPAIEVQTNGTIAGWILRIGTFAHIHDKTKHQRRRVFTVKQKQRTAGNGLTKSETQNNYDIKVRPHAA